MILKKYISKFIQLILISFSIVGNSNIKKFIIIFFLSFLSAVLELIGIGLVEPVLDILFNKDERYFDFFKIDYSLNIILFLLITIYLIKSIVVLFANKYQFKTVYNLSSEISKRLYYKNINQDYIFFTKNNTAQYLRNIFNECYIFSNGIVLTLIKLFSDFIIFIFILCFLIFFDPIITLSLILYLGLITVMYIYFLKDHLKILGEKRTFHEANRIKLIQEGFRSFEFLKVFNLQKFFTEKYNFHNKKSHEIFINERFYNSIPKIILEFFIILFLVGIIYFFFLSQTEMNEMIIIVSMFTLVSARLIPIFNSLYGHIQSLQFNYPVVFNLKENLKLEIPMNYNNDIDKIDIKKNFKLENIYYNYPEVDNIVLDNVTISFNFGDIVSISGPSGSGKTTLLNIIIGSLTPSGGKIFIDEKHILKEFMIEGLTYVPQNTFLIDESFKNNIVLNRVYDEKKYMMAIKYSGLLEYYNSMKVKEENVGENASKLSGGQIQRISIARAIYNNPKIIILDEPTSSIDKKTSDDIYQNLKLLNREVGSTVIVVSHFGTPKDFASISYFVNEGKIIKK